MSLRFEPNLQARAADSKAASEQAKACGLEAEAALLKGEHRAHKARTYAKQRSPLK